MLGAAFYLMGHIDGWSPISVDGWPMPFDTDLDAATGLAFELIDGIAQLVDGRLGNAGSRASAARRLPRPQVDRWLAHLSKFQVREIPGIDVAAAWLARIDPRSAGPASSTATTSSPT